MAEWEGAHHRHGAEKLPYQAARVRSGSIQPVERDGDRLRGGNRRARPGLHVDGAAETLTVTGTAKVYLQHESQTMQAVRPNDGPLRRRERPWVSYLQRLRLFHGAGWRPGTWFHGCANMPVSRGAVDLQLADTNTVSTATTEPVSAPVT